MSARQKIKMQTPALLANVGTPTVTPQGTGGAATWGYKVVARNSVTGRTAAASAEGTTAAGNATIDGVNFNRITWTDVAGYDTYDIYRTTSGGTPASLGLIGSVGTGVESFDDTGLVGDASTAPSVNTTGDGDAVEVREFDQNCTVYIGGVGTATYQVQISADGVTWFDEGSAVTDADGNVDITKKCNFVRSQCTAYTSGTPTAWVVG